MAALAKKNYEIVADDLRSAIASNLLKSGDRLPTIETLAQQYGVGRSTVREALSLLKASGLIESVQGGGTFVRQSGAAVAAAHQHQLLANAAELSQLLAVRKILEVGAIRLASLHRSEADLTELARIIQQMENSSGNESLSQVYDVHFHLALAAATKNQLLTEMMTSLTAQMTRTIRDTRQLWMLYSAPDAIQPLIEEHQAMLQAVADQDEAAAERLMYQHLTKVEQALARL